MSFTVATLYCCCFSFLQTAPKKHDCCVTKKEHHQKTAQHDCAHCNATLKADLTAKDASQIAIVVTPAPLTFNRAIAYRPVNSVKSLYLNGPPGPRHVVPLYLQLHTLRI